MPRLLLVTHSFPPIRGPESFLAAGAAKALSRRGWSVSVLTVSENDSMEATDVELNTALPGSVSVERAPSLERLLYSIPIAGKMVRRALLFTGLPTPEMLWFPFALCLGKRLLATSRCDVIYSRAFSPVSNIVALSLKQATHVPWVAHWSDPWVDSPYFRPMGLQRRSCLWIERSVLREADAVVFVTPQAADLVMAKYPTSWRDKVHILPHAYDPEQVPGAQCRHHGDRRLCMVYTGTFYGDRSPASLFQALLRLKASRNLRNDLRVTLIGPITPRYRALCLELGLEDIVDFVGPVSRRSSLLATAQADLLLLVDAPSDAPSVFLPSKLVDYISVSKPILGITPTQGASADLLRKLGCDVVDPLDTAGIASAISALLDAWLSGNWGLPAQYPQVAREFELGKSAAVLDRLLRSLTSLQCTQGSRERYEP